MLNFLRINIITGFFIVLLSPIPTAHGQRQVLSDRWFLKSSVLVEEEGTRVSSVNYDPEEWYETSVPTTVLSTLIKHGVYPDVRIALNSFKIPDSSDEFNRKNGLSKFSHMPDKRNPWRDPYWYYRGFSVPNKCNSGKIFQDMCSSCHKVKNIGTEVGSDLKIAYSSPIETLVRDIWWPSEKINTGYETFVVNTIDSEKYSGILVKETSNSPSIAAIWKF